MAKINRLVTSEIEGSETASSEIPPLGFHYNSQGTLFLNTGSSASKKVLGAGAVYGAGADSADLAGSDTIKLYPDANVEGTSDQYVVIDASSPDEVHIRSGGLENSSTSTLFLGGAENFVSVDDTSRSVGLSVTSADNIQTKLEVLSTGNIATNNTLYFPGAFPIAFRAEFDANSFVINNSATDPYGNGTGFYCDVLMSIDPTGAITTTATPNTHTSNVGYTPGDTFRFGQILHGLPAFVDITLNTILEISSTQYTFTVTVEAPTEVTAIIEAERPAIIKYGSNRITLASDGHIVLDNQTRLYQQTVSTLNSFTIQTNPLLESKFHLLTRADDGNLAVITTNDLSHTMMHIGDSDQYIRLSTDGNIMLRAVDRSQITTSATWKATHAGTFSSSNDNIYLKQATDTDSNVGIFTSDGTELTISSGENLFLVANSATTFTLTESGNIVYPNGTTVSGATWASTYPSFMIQPDPTNLADISLSVYATNSTNPRLYLRPGTAESQDFIIGALDNGIKLDKTGNVSLTAGPGQVADVGTTPGTDGRHIYLTAGAAGSNQGDPDYGAMGGNVYITAGLSSRSDLPGGSVFIAAGSGYNGSGNVILASGDKQFVFRPDGNLQLPSAGGIVSSTGVSLLGDGTSIANGSYVLSVASTGPVNVPTASTGKGRLQNADGMEILVNSGGNAKLFEFTPAGSFTIPTGANILTKNSSLNIGFEDFTGSPVVSGETVSINLNGMRVPYNTAAFSFQNNESFSFEGAATDQRITFSNSYGFIKFGTTTRDNTGSINDIELWSYGGNNSHGNVYISAGSSPTNQRWTFNSFGNIIFPDGTTQSTAYTGVDQPLINLDSSSGVVVHNCASNRVFYHTMVSDNFTANFTNLNLGNNFVTTITLVIQQGSTGYYPNAVQIAGNGVPLVWRGATNPTPSSNRIDLVTFRIFYNGLYTVLGELTGF